MMIIGDVSMLLSTVYLLCHRVGSCVKPMTKAKTSTHKGTANEIFSPSHVTLFANELSDIVEADIMSKVKV